MQIRRALLATLLVILTVPLAAQDDRAVFFSLSSDRTYLPGEKARVQVWAQNVDTLEFRVYRVNDPVAFFQKLEDHHQFGGRAPRLAMEETWLERFHDWKREWRNRVRDLFRMQYTAESRERIRDWWAERQKEKAPKPQPGAPATQFAQVPVLNPQQLVSTWRQNVRTGKNWESATVPVDLPGKGLYLVEAVHAQLRAYTILNVTELGIITKAAPGRLLAFLQDRKTGAPQPNCAVWVLADKLQPAQLRTDAQGLVERTFTDDASPEGVLVLARQGDDFAVVTPSEWNLSSDAGHSMETYIYTDRPVYRPGHSVNYRAILRSHVGAAYRLPEQRKVQVEIHDPDDKTVAQQELNVSPVGTIHGEFTLPATAALGYYSIQVHVGEAQAYGGFEVEEYKKPEYEVRVTPAVRHVLQGQSVKVNIEARYYFGEPVANAKVVYVVHRSRYWSPLMYRDEDEQADDSESGDEGDYGAEQESEETGQLDAEGRLTVSIPTRVSEHRTDLTYRIEARVTDQGNREISGKSYVIVTYGSFMLGIEADNYFHQPGETGEFRIRARDYDDHPVATPVRVELVPWRWQEKGQEPQPLATANGATDAKGETRVKLPLAQSGSYFVRVVARTPEGRNVENRTYVWVSGGSSMWYSERRERIQIIPDKKSYRPGETAHVLVITGVPDAHVLFTAEGQELFSKQVVTATGPTFTVDIPIRGDFQPNFYLGVAFLRDNQLYEGSKSINVPPIEHQLSVDMQPSKSQFQPGEQAVYTVTARDSDGKPVAAEFSLGVVDEAIYAVRPETTQDIVKFFYGHSYDRVGTASSLSYYFSGAAGKRAMQLAMSGGSRGFAQLKPERLVEPKVRKAFPDTAYWVADLSTDSTGRAQARFSFPDSLTTWRATARGVSRDTRVGSAIQHTVVRKNLILRLVVPRFFTEGDEVTVSALVHNYLTTEKTARVSLVVDGLEVLEGATRDIAIPSRGEARVDWRVRAKTVRQAVITGKALTNEESDAMELTLPVNPYGVKLSIARAGSLDPPNAEADAELTFPPQATPSSRALEVNVSPSLAGAIFSALDYLTSYPYGCTEQTMSSFLPNIVVAKALKDLGVKSNIDPAVLQKKIDQGLERLYDFQHEDGGWGWWKTDESGAFMTAYVVSGLAQAKAAGINVREDVLTRGRDWLRADFDRESRALPDLRAYLAYTLAQAGSRDAAVLDAVWQRRADLSPYGTALLGLAFETAGDSRAGEMAAQLESQVKSDAQEAWWPVDRDMLMDFYGDASPEATAYAMKLLSHLRPSSPLLPKAALWLVNHRSEGYWWYSTKQTAMVIYGLTDYLKASGELKPNFSVRVTVNGREVLSRRFAESDALAPGAQPLRLAAADLAAGSNKVHITKSGSGRLYWSARAEYYSAEEKLQRTGSISLNILREYFRLVPEQQSAKIVYRLEPLQGALAVGDVLVARLTVSGGDWRYLLIEDPIPAGLEFIERDDLYEIKDRPSWWETWFTRREFHDDHAAFFQTLFSRHQTQYLYLMKVVNPGKFRVSPARVQPMYQPQIVATTEGKIVEVK
jgi:hypothetical protein